MPLWIKHWQRSSEYEARHKLPDQQLTSPIWGNPPNLPVLYATATLSRTWICVPDTGSTVDTNPGSLPMNSTLTRLALAAALAATLSACNHDDDDKSRTASPPMTGTFTDSAVQGLHYQASPSGLSGTTDAEGHFSYREGDTITFSLGGITLGSGVQADDTVTPQDLVGTASGSEAENITTNILVLLQSLDADDDPSNGIDVSAITSAMTTGISLDFTDAPTDFANAGTGSIDNIIDAASDSVSAYSNNTIVDPEDALEHFGEQLMERSVGTWKLASGTEVVILRIDEHGNFLLGGVDTTEAEDATFEKGFITVANAATGEISVSTTIDNEATGNDGLHDSRTRRFTVNGDTLTIQDYTGGSLVETVNFTRVSNSTTSITGAWSLDNSLNSQNFVFLSNNKYMMLDPVGDSGCGDPGVEYGDYTFSAGSLNITATAVDTNGCAGLHDTEDASFASFAVVFRSIDSANTTTKEWATFTGSDDGENFAVALYRSGTTLLSASEFYSKLQGIWTFVETEAGAVDTSTSRAVIRFDAPVDGSVRYLLGTATPDTADRGMERGTVSYNEETGVLSYSVASGTGDTNGNDNGLSGTVGQQHAVFDGDDLIVLDDGDDTFVHAQRVTNTSGSIIGAWVDDGTFNTSTFIFFADGKYLMIDPLGDTEGCGGDVPGDTLGSDLANCGTPGMEYGSYSWNATSKSLAITSNLYDTNGEAGAWSGVSELSPGATFTAGDTSATLLDGETITLYRVPANGTVTLP